MKSRQEFFLAGAEYAQKPARKKTKKKTLIRCTNIDTMYTSNLKLFTRFDHFSLVPMVQHIPDNWWQIVRWSYNNTGKFDIVSPKYCNTLAVIVAKVIPSKIDETTSPYCRTEIMKQVPTVWRMVSLKKLAEIPLKVYKIIPKTGNPVMYVNMRYSWNITLNVFKGFIWLPRSPARTQIRLFRK